MAKYYKIFAASLALIALGIIFNSLKVPVLFGVEFFFGSVFALVGAALFGPFVGFAMAIAIASITLGTIYHPFFIAISATEALAVGYMTRRLKNNLLFASALFWLSIGSVFVWVSYYHFMDTSFIATLMVWLKQSVNGIFNAFLASLILIGINIFQHDRPDRSQLTFHQVFFTTLVGLVMIPSFTLLLVTSRSKMASIEQELNERTKSLTHSVDSVLTGWRRARLEAVTELSKVASERGINFSPEFERDISLIAKSASGFDGMLVTDMNGTILTSFVAGFPDSRGILGISIGFRPFFTKIREGSDHVISDIFVSKGLTQVPIIAFAKPIIKDGQAIGVAIGAADIKTLENALNRYSSSAGVTISLYDETGAVIASTAKTPLPLNEQAGGKTGLNQPGSFHRLPPPKNFVPNMTRWEHSVYGSKNTATSLPWSIVVEASLLPYSRELQRSYTEIFGIMLALCFGGLGFSYILTRWIGKPIAHLADVTSGFASQMDEEKPIKWPWSPVFELKILINNSKGMANALKSRFQDLQIEIKERTKTQERLTAATTAAQSASRAKSEFLANMSHEIRTPLGAVLGFAELLTNQDLNAEERNEGIKAIKRNGEQLFRLIDDVLDFSKIEVGHVKLESSTTNFNDIIDGSISISARVAEEKGLKLLVSNSSPLPGKFQVDQTRLKQIILNVVGNAVKFTDQGTVEAVFSIDKKSDKAKSLLKIRVSDTGIGFNRDDAEDKLFRVFGQIDSSSSRRYGGTGLGLILSRRIAEAMGGDVALLDANTDKGCVFEISVEVAIDPAEVFYPTLSEARQAGQTQNTIEKAKKSLSGLSLLVVEDAPDNRLLFKRALTSLGATVDVAESGIDGVSIASKKTYDVILMDIQMPGLDGLEATKVLRKNGYKGPIAALTAHALQEDRRKCLEAGFDEYLSKPVDWKRLTEVINQLSNRT